MDFEMIIGHGDIAQALFDRQGAILFASGVSNSQETSECSFARERQLLTLFQNSNESLFYFSTLSINFVDTPYTRHKIYMEVLVRRLFKNYNIIRIGNITFGKNPNTFINYFQHCIENNLPYTVRDEYKYLVDQRELCLLTDNLPLTGKHSISVTGRIVKVQDVVDQLIERYGQKAVHTNHQ